MNFNRDAWNPAFPANLKTNQKGYEVKSDVKSQSQLSSSERIFESNDIMPFSQDVKWESWFFIL